MTHTAEYFRARRRAQGIPERDGFDHPRFVAQGRELNWIFDAPLRDLRWLRNCSGNDVTIGTLMAEGDVLSPKTGKTPDPLKCANPTCPTRHNHAVSRVTGDPGSRRVLWYCTMRCRNIHLAGA
jgi:hypothetical protein